MFDEKDTKRIISEIRKRKAHRVFLQVPEGLKMKVQDFAQLLDKSGIETLISADPCYGACDVKDYEAKQLGCDLLLHVGHSDLGLATKVPVIYEEYRIDFDPVPLLKNNLKELRPYKKICMVTTLQFLDSLKRAKKFLEAEGKKVFVAGSGQILGCDVTGAEALDSMVDCFLFLGSGSFHPMGLAIQVEKPVLMLSYETGDLVNLETERNVYRRIKAAHIEKARESQNFGILISTKPGQMRIKAAEHAKKMLKTKGKKAWILVMNEITPEKLMGLKLDCLVDCACPRMAEDFKMFKKPILTPEDLEKL
jgi:2-(3-amino-3-carboxypropyl)histidine synthase